MLHVHEFFKRHKGQFTLFLKASLAEFLPSWFRAYHELRRRLQPGQKTLVIQPHELAASLGYDLDRVQGIIRDFSLLEVISCEGGTADSDPWTITLQVF